MANRKKDDRALSGERWRLQMTDSQEGIPSLVWRRVFALFRIDLSDPKQATSGQIYALLHELMESYEKTDTIDVEVLDLESCIDSQVPRIFPKPT